MNNFTAYNIMKLMGHCSSAGSEGEKW